MVKFRNKSTCLPLCANVLLVFTQDGMSCFLLFCWVPHLPQCISAGFQNITQRPVGLHCNARVSWNAFDLSKSSPFNLLYLPLVTCYDCACSHTLPPYSEVLNPSQKPLIAPCYYLCLPAMWCVGFTLLFHILFLDAIVDFLNFKFYYSSNIGLVSFMGHDCCRHCEYSKDQNKILDSWSLYLARELDFMCI